MQPQQNKWLASPQAIQRPGIDPRLEELNVVVRSTECLRHFILSTEFWISPSGRLRWWLKINLTLCAWLFVPSVFVTPILGRFPA